VKHFPVSRGLIRRKVIGMVRAVEGVSFEIARGETLALVGESGCGKSTTGRLVLRLMDPTAGSVRFKGEEIATLDKHALRRLRRHMQIIFQDPYASLNPRMTVGEILAEPMAVHDLHTEAERATGSRTCSTSSASCPSTRGAIRTSSPAASASASASPARWRSTPT
jgi:oligopeptide transport system ATP-binding protein